MTNLSIILFDDAVARAWEPFALTRPIGELTFGAMTMRERAQCAFGAAVVAHLADDHLGGFDEADAPPVRLPSEPPTSAARLFLSSRAVVDWGIGSDLRNEGPVSIGGEVVGWFSPEGSSAPDAAFFLDPHQQASSTNGVELPGKILRHVWELMTGNAAQVAADVAALFPAAKSAELPAGAFRFGDHPLVLGEGVRIEPGVVFDTTAGPIWLDARVQVKGFTRLAGPAYVGRESIVLGGTLEACSIGRVCRIRGEFAHSVCLGWVNKAHDGHIGHAYLGAWVNLGAETTNSDLKNNYGTVRLWTPEGEVDTGQMKVGCFLGDHVKTGIGLLLNTGTVVGAGSNLFGAAMPPKYVPPFSWGSGDDLTEFKEDKFLELAERAMGRRNVSLSEGMRGQLAAAWRRGRSQV